MVKCRQNVNFEETDTKRLTGKNDGFWLLWQIFKEYIKQNIIMAVLRKAHSNIKEDPRRKTDPAFDFFRALPSTYEVLIKRNFDRILKF